MESNRKVSKKEEKLIEFLIKTSSKIIPNDWKNGLLVCEIEDGGMGGLQLIPRGINHRDRIFGEQVSEYVFKDIDGVDVIASLNLDKEGNLFELDIWKVNFEPLLKFPDII